MPAPDPSLLDRWRELPLADSGGATIGTISEFYLDRVTRQPTWALVHSGLFGTRRTFVPLAQATEVDGTLRVPYDKAQVKDAPRVEDNGELTPDEEALLYRHYGLPVNPPEAEADAEGNPGDTS